MGNLFVLVFSPDAITAGASTALYSMFASIVVLRYASRNPYLQQLGQSYLSLLVINLVGSVLIPGISLAGHVGGAVGGALLAIVFPVRGERKIYSPGQRDLATLAFIALSALLLFLSDYSKNKKKPLEVLKLRSSFPMVFLILYKKLLKIHYCH